MAKYKKQSSIEEAAPKAEAINKPSVKTQSVTIIRDGFGYSKGQKVVVGPNGVQDLKSKKLI